MRPARFAFAASLLAAPAFAAQPTPGPTAIPSTTHAKPPVRRHVVPSTSTPVPARPPVPGAAPPEQVAPK